MPFRILALETSTQIGSVCLMSDGKLLSERRADHQRSHSEFLNRAIQEVLDEHEMPLSEIDLFATGIGPGSFTGIRIALNACKTFSYFYGKPIAALDTLTVLAHSLLETDLPVLTLVNAYKNMTYSALYRFEDSAWVQARAPEAVGVQQLSAWLATAPESQNLDSMYVVGDGYQTYLPYLEPALIQKLVRPKAPVDFPLAAALGQLAHSKHLAGQTIDWKLLKPLYIRDSEAEETKRGLFYSPLK